MHGTITLSYLTFLGIEMNKLFTSLHLFIFLILFIIHIVLGVGTTEDNGVKCLEKEKLALLNIKAELIDDYGRLSTWGIEEDKKDCCLWKGVFCDDLTNHVVALDLQGPQYFDLQDPQYFDLQGPHYSWVRSAPLQGKISLSLLELVHLHYLDLSANDFNETQIPEFIGSLANLQHLNLSSSTFGGLIPHHLGNLSMLRLLDLSRNWYVSAIDLDWLWNLQSLEYLDLSIVNLEKATSWIQAIQKLTTLKAIYLKSCGLEDNFTTSLPSINASNSLAILDLSSNYLSTATASAIHRFLNFSSRFSYIDFSSNNLKGRIPDGLGNLMSLSHLDLSNNMLEGRIPNALGNLISLTHLDLSVNNLEGGIPRALGRIISLSHLSLSRNLLVGDIPFSFKNLSNLRVVDLSHNNLNGQLSLMMDSFWNSTTLENLDFSKNQIWGSLPSISRFLILRKLRLEDNELNGSLADGSLRFPNLEVLVLSRNQFVGSVPDLSSCSSLRLLYLNDNMFNGTLNTQGIGYLSKLEYLDLGSNNFEGTINETHLFNNSQLRNLDLSFNSNLTLNINSRWNPPFQLDTIKLANCKLGPNFPKWLQKQKKVFHLDISNTKISDSIPTWFWDNSQMVKHLNMSYNQIYGVLPHFLSIPFHLSVVDLRSNEFNGSLPRISLFLYYLDLSRNKFSGTVNYLCSAHHPFSVLDLSNNVLSGELSEDCFKNMMTLVYLNLANNNFSGKIQSSFNTECYLSSLHLRNNSFRGYFPTSLRNCDGLQMADLGENNFTGIIPGWIGEKMSNLGVLSLKANKFSGTLPTSLCHLTKIQVLDISMNMISGPIPRCVNDWTYMSSKQDSNKSMDDGRYTVHGNTTAYFYDRAQIMWKGKEAEYVKELASLKTIDLSSNNFVGEIPREITSLVDLLGLNLSRNKLVGSIPRDIGELKFLNFLDLSENNLSDSIPDTLSQLNHLGVLNLSFNNLSGRIPWITHLQTFSSSSYIGNPGLCGPPLSKPCLGDEMPKNPISTSNLDGMDSLDPEDKFITRGFFISIALGFIVGFWGVFGTLSLNNSCRIKLFTMLKSVVDWLYVKMLVNKNRLQRYFQS